MLRRRNGALGRENPDDICGRVVETRVANFPRSLLAETVTPVVDDFSCSSRRRRRRRRRNAQIR
jgi:hypothetical protein